jgi:hypothetical protein
MAPDNMNSNLPNRWSIYSGAGWSICSGLHWSTSTGAGWSISPALAGSDIESVSKSKVKDTLHTKRLFNGPFLRYQRHFLNFILNLRVRLIISPQEKLAYAESTNDCSSGVFSMHILSGCVVKDQNIGNVIITMDT